MGCELLGEGYPGPSGHSLHEQRKALLWHHWNSGAILGEVEGL